MISERRIGWMLWDAGRVESSAVSAFRILESSPYLSDRELASLERFEREEAEHGRVTTEWGRKLHPTPPAAAPFTSLARRDVMAALRLSEPMRTVATLAAVHWNEQNTLRRYPGWIESFRRLGLPGLAQDLDQILAEERHHVEWGRRVLSRWQSDQPQLWRQSRQAIRLAGRVYAAVLTATHRDLWQEVQRATR